LAAAALVGLALLPGCGAIERPQQPAADGVVTSTTVPSAAVLKAALLSDVDVPGSTPAPPPESGSSGSGIDDITSCTELGASGDGAEDPNEVVGPDLQLSMGGTTFTYGSSATIGPAEEVAGFISTLATGGANACMLDAFKAGLMAIQGSPKVDLSGLSVNAWPVEIADGGAILGIKGSLKVAGRQFRLGLNLGVFRRGQVLVTVMVVAAAGEVVSGETDALARRIAGRLP
jgi:hypothetical protein